MWDEDCVHFLQWALQRLHMRWQVLNQDSSKPGISLGILIKVYPMSFFKARYFASDLLYCAAGEI
jgi:hypothetical protein